MPPSFPGLPPDFGSNQNNNHHNHHLLNSLMSASNLVNDQNSPMSLPSSVLNVLNNSSFTTTPMPPNQFPFLAPPPPGNAVHLFGAQPFGANQNFAGLLSSPPFGITKPDLAPQFCENFLTKSEFFSNLVQCLHYPAV